MAIGVKQVSESEVLTINIPVRRSTHGYKTNRIDVTLNTADTERLADIFSGLQRDGAQLKNGRPVGSPQQAVVWILQNLEYKK